jgi:uncharacterized protein (DUF983 family)
VQGMWRGLRGHCPNCAKAPLFWRYLKIQPACQSCGHDLARYPADDGPAYFTILIVGHLIIAPLLLFPFIWQVSPAIVVPATLIPLAGAVLLVLPRVKGAFVGLMWALGVTDRDSALHTADAAE